MRRREQFAAACVAGTFCLAGLAFGGAVRWAAVAVAVTSVASALPFVTSRRIAISRSPLLVLLAIAIAFTALQLLPLPRALAEFVVHDKLEVITDNAVAWHAEAPAFVTASFDPPATLLELVKLIGYAALAFAAIRLSSDRTARRRLGVIVAGTAAIISLVMLGHAVLGMTRIYGIFGLPPAHIWVSPIINDNHFSGLMAMAVPVALALASTTVGFARALWLGASLLCAVTCLLVSSRGGAIGLVIGLVVTATLMLLQRRTGNATPRLRRHFPVAAIVTGGCVVILLGALAASQVTNELAKTRIETIAKDPHWKVQTWRHAVAMFESNPWLGSGRGAFEPAYTRWGPVGDSTFEYVENSYLQAAVDWGAPGAIAISVALIAVAVAAARRWNQSPLEAGALGALVSLAAHDFVDFSVELPVVAMSAILLVAILLPARLDDGKVPSLARQKWLRGGFLGVAFAACVLAASPLGQPAHDAATDLAGAHEERLAHATLAVERHPADYLLMGRAAQIMMENGDPRAVGVVARALTLNPSHAGLHRLAATMLLRSQLRSQALGELASAVANATDPMLRDLVREISATFPDPIEAARAFPFDPELLDRISPLLAPTKPLAFEYARRVAMLNPSDVRAQLLLANEAIATKRVDVAIAAAREAYMLKRASASTLVLAQALATHGETTEAIATLRTALDGGISLSAHERFDVATALVDVQIVAGALSQATVALDELDHLVANNDERIIVHLHRALLHDRLGDTNRANWERAQAAKLQTGGGS